MTARIRPSRLSVGILTAVGVLVLGSHLYRRRESRQVTEDGPPVTVARHLLRCVAGRDAQRLLGPRPAQSVPAPHHDDTSLSWQDHNDEVVPGWQDRLNDRLRRIVATEQGTQWPGRCVPFANTLVAQLEARNAFASLVPARELRDRLRALRDDRLGLIRSVDSGELGHMLARAMFAVSGNSDGSEQDWDSQLGAAATDLWPIVADSTPRPVPLPDDADLATLVLPDLVLYQSRADRRLHRITYDRADHPTDRAIGRGAPALDLHRDGVVRVADDSGDSIFVPGGEPAEMVPFPDAVRNGDEALGPWQFASSDGFVWLLTVSDGVAIVRIASREPPPHWSEPVARLGDPETVVGGVLARDRSAADTMRAYIVVRRARGVDVERFTLTASADGASVTRDPTPSPVVPEYPVFAPRIATCASGDGYFALLSGTDGVAMIHDFDAVGDKPVHYAVLEGFDPARSHFDCTDASAVVFGAPGPRIPVFTFEGAGISHPIANDSPIPDEARIEGAAVLGDGRLVVLADNGVTLRAFRRERTQDADTVVWSGGALVALRSMGVGEGDERHAHVISMFAQGTQVAALLAVSEGRRTFVARVASRDGGEHWGAQGAGAN